MGYIGTIFTLGGINVVMVLGLAILTGYTGLFSMGNMGFMMIGAYATTIVYKLFIEMAFFQIPVIAGIRLAYFAALLCGGILTTVAGFLIGFPTVRSKLKGDHFAIAMMGFASAVRVIVSNSKNDIVGGAQGLKNLPKYTTLAVVAVIVVILVYMLTNYVRSAYGRNARAIREQEVAAEIMGVRVSRTKLLSVLICAFCTGIGGGLYAFYMTMIAPQMFLTTISNNQLIMVVFGGINSITGPVLSALALSVLPELLRFIGEWRLVIYGVLVVVIMLVKPEGLLGYTELSDIFKGIRRWFKNRKQKKADAVAGGAV